MIDLRVEAYRKRYSHLRPRFENFLNEVVILPELKPDRIRLAPAQARADGVELSLRSVRCATAVLVGELHVVAG